MEVHRQRQESSDREREIPEKPVHASEADDVGIQHALAVGLGLLLVLGIAVVPGRVGFREERERTFEFARGGAIDELQAQCVVFRQSVTGQQIDAMNPLGIWSSGRIVRRRDPVHRRYRTSGRA